MRHQIQRIERVSGFQRLLENASLSTYKLQSSESFRLVFQKIRQKLQDEAHLREGAQIKIWTKE